MKKTNCRIGKVTPKGNLFLLPPPAMDINSLADLDFQEMHESLDDMRDMFPEGVGGVVTVVFGMNGKFSRALRLHKKCFIGPTLLPSYIADILRRDIAKDVAKDVIEERL